MTEHSNPADDPEPPRPEYTEDTPTPPNGLSIEARQWQQTQDDDVRELDFNQYRSDR